jgi:hypothetical protein
VGDGGIGVRGFSWPKSFCVESSQFFFFFIDLELMTQQKHQLHQNVTDFFIQYFICCLHRVQRVLTQLLHTCQLPRSTEEN